MGLGKLLDKTGVAEASSINFGIVEAGSPIPVKFGFQNDKDRSVNPIISFISQDANDLDDYMLVALDLITLSCPYNFAVTLIAQTTYLTPLETYYYVITAYNCNGETGPSTEIEVTVPDGSHTPKLTWTPILGADGYYIYRSIESGNFVNAMITKIIGQSVSTFIDTGTPVGNQSVPSANTTAGGAPNYGTPLIHANFYATIALGQVAPGQQKFFWKEVDAPLTISEVYNPRHCTLRISE